jgi:enoyl-CoA hydratase
MNEPTAPGSGASSAADASSAAAEELVLVDFPARGPDGAPLDHVALLTLNRPRALNAINRALVSGLVAAAQALDADLACRAIVIRGSGERAFAAGADIREMADETPDSVDLVEGFARWDRLREIGVPLIAAVRGFALGGGCELAMTCDLIVAGDDAQFGQPEVKLGIIPGAGGTQRLTRAIGKSRAMELILTGRTFSAQDAERWGLVTAVVPAASTVDAALALASRIATMPPLAVRAAKAAVAKADELGLGDGLAFERRAFLQLFASEDQKEGMHAFMEKRPADFHGR